MAKIRQSNLDNSVIIGNVELAETAAANDILLVYDTSSGTIKKILSSNIGVQAPTFTSVSPTNVNTGDGTGNATFTITGANFDATVTAKLKTTGGADLNFDSVTRDSATQITGVIAISSLSNANEPYDVVITNGNGLITTATDQININAQPVYVTASGSLGEQLANTAGSFSVNATDPESAGNVTFELQSGSLPPGYSITNTAAEGGTAIISGTDTVTSSATTFNFVLRAVDAASNTTSRAFSIRTTVPVSESFTASGTFSIPSGITSADVLVVAGGGGGGPGGPTGAGAGAGGGGAGAGGLIFFPSYPLNPSGTITVTVGNGGGANSNGQSSSFGSPGDPGFTPSSSVLTANGGGAGGYAPLDAGSSGGSGGGGGAGNGSQSSGGTATQPTAPGNSGAYGFGNPGGNSAGTDYQSGGGGGGGAGASGSTNTGFAGSPGGDGRAYTIADGTTPVYYAGGGGGGGGHIPGGGGTPAPGGQGGGGAGGAAPSGSGSNGGVNTGGGAGGGSQPAAGGGTGGKGIVIVRY